MTKVFERETECIINWYIIVPGIYVGHNKFDAGELLVILLDMEDNGETFPPETSAQSSTCTSKQTSKLPDIYKADSGV